jgi:hypothetical protein
MHEIKTSISHSRWFDTQQQMALFLDIKNASKKAISRRCKLFGFGVEFNDYYGEYNIKEPCL